MLCILILALLISALQALCKQLCIQFEPKFIVQDASLAEYNAVVSCFPTCMTLMCWFHVLLNVRKSDKRKSIPTALYDSVLKDIRYLHYSLSSEFESRKVSILSSDDICALSLIIFNNNGCKVRSATGRFSIHRLVSPVHPTRSRASTNDSLNSAPSQLPLSSNWFAMSSFHFTASTSVHSYSIGHRASNASSHRKSFRASVSSRLKTR